MNWKKKLNKLKVGDSVYLVNPCTPTCSSCNPIIDRKDIGIVKIIDKSGAYINFPSSSFHMTFEDIKKV